MIGAWLDGMPIAFEGNFTKQYRLWAVGLSGKRLNMIIIHRGGHVLDEMNANHMQP